MVKNLNAETLSQPGLKDLLTQRSQEYKKEARIYALAAGSAFTAQLVTTYTSISSGNIGLMAGMNILLGPLMGTSIYYANDRANLAKSFSIAREDLVVSTQEADTSTGNLLGIEAALEHAADLTNKKPVTRDRLLDVAKYQTLRMPFVNKYNDTGDLAMLEAQKDLVQEAYLKSVVEDREFQPPELKTNSESSEELDMIKQIWLKTQVVECNWATANLKDDKDAIRQADWMFYATNMNIDRGLSGKLVEKAATILNINTNNG